MKIAKSFTFEAAHRLKDHNGKCRNIHGHSYRVVIEIKAKGAWTANGSWGGMLIDFGELKTWWSEHMEPHFDHKLLLQFNDPLVDVLESSAAMEGPLGPQNIDDLPEDNVQTFPFPPTAENFADYFRDEVLAWLHSNPDRTGLNASVTVYETPTSCATA